MAGIKSLVKDTAIYGLSSIIGRFLNYLLVPIYTRVLDPGEYGIVTNLYGYTALVLVILTFGMETTYFRFANKEEDKADTVFTNSFAFVSTLTLVFLITVFLFIDPISRALHYTDHRHYILLMAVVVSIDVIQALPFCRLRLQKKAMKFASLRLLFIALNISLNLLYFVVWDVRDVTYVFVLNLVCSTIITFFFLPDLFKLKWELDFSILRQMLDYTWPLFILGITGILNQTADKIIFPLVYPDEVAGKELLGIYGGCVKIAMIMAMITQAFRYAYEPIVFAQAKSKDKNETYALGMKFFIIFTLLAFLAVIAFLPILQEIVGKKYQVGMKVVPIVMIAEIMMGVYFNLSFWYKLIDKTIYGAWFSMAGCIVLFAVNLLGIPHFSYMACAWGGLLGYGTAMTLSYIVGQRMNPIRYDLKSIGCYVLLTALLYFAMTAFEIENRWLCIGYRTIMLLFFVAYIVWKDLPIKSILQRIKR